MKKAFTLIELLVYMAIMGFIVVVAGRAFSDSTGMRVRTQNMIKATEEVNRIAEIMKEDLSQMGAKTWMNQTAGDLGTVNSVYIGGTGNDRSSFRLWHRTDLPNGNDSIEFRKISYDSDGNYMAVRLISWALSADSILRRRCATIYATAYSASSDPESDVCREVSTFSGSPLENAIPVAMAAGVQTFAMLPSTPSSEETFGGPSSGFSGSFSFLSRGTGIDDYYATDIEPPQAVNSNTAILSDFERNNAGEQKRHQIFVAEPGIALTSDFTSCKGFEFKRGETYAVKFTTPMNMNLAIPDSMMALFQLGKDHMAVGFRNKADGGPITQLPTDFLFGPPQEGSANLINQSFEFSVPSDVSNACVAFTFAFYSGSADVGPHKGKLRIKDFELSRKRDVAYVFVRNALDCGGLGLGSDCYDEDYATESDAVLDNKKHVKAFELVLEVNKRKEIGSTRTNNLSGYIIPVPNNGITPQ